MLATLIYIFFFFNDTATTEIYTLSLHDALPILLPVSLLPAVLGLSGRIYLISAIVLGLDRKSTRLNSSHMSISYAVFCLKKKNSIQITREIVTHIHTYSLHSSSRTIFYVTSSSV